LHAPCLFCSYPSLSKVIAGAADAMREKAMPCLAADVIDIVGTGGDGIGA
jgi:anthranilate phosphoribosyltransferase